MSRFSKAFRSVSKVATKVVAAVEKIPIIGKPLVAAAAPFLLPTLPVIAALNVNVAKSWAQKYVETVPTQLAALGAGLTGGGLAGVALSGLGADRIGVPGASRARFSPEAIPAEAAYPNGEYLPDAYGPADAVPVYWHGAAADDTWGVPGSGWGVPWSSSWNGIYWPWPARALQPSAYSSWYSGTYL